jgi:hypothetical protein
LSAPEVTRRWTNLPAFAASSLRSLARRHGEAGIRDVDDRQVEAVIRMA